MKGICLKLFLWTVLVCLLLSGCSGIEQTVNETGKSTTEVSILMPSFGRKWTNDNPITAEIEKRMGIKLDVRLVPEGQEFSKEFYVLAASAELPDIVRLENFDCLRFAEQGVFIDVASLIDQYGSNLKKYIAKENWNILNPNDQITAIPFQDAHGRTVTAVRKDWLNKLKLEVPSTLEAYKEMLSAFTYGDPDGNGKNDTYGIGSDGEGMSCAFMQVFGAFGMQPGQVYIKDNAAYPANISGEYKEALQFINGLWKDGVIDPELFIIKPDQAMQKLSQGKCGSFTSKQLTPYTLSNECDPVSEWTTLFPAIIGADGKSGMRDMGGINGSTHIAANSKNAAAAIRLLDFLLSDDGVMLANCGVSGIHYDYAGNEINLLPQGRAALDEMSLDVLGHLVGVRFDDIEKVKAFATRNPNKVINPFTTAATEYALIKDDFYGLPMTGSELKYMNDLQSYETEMLIKFITGQEAFDNWNNYIENWIAKGGGDILNERLRLHNENTGSECVSTVD